MRVIGWPGEDQEVLVRGANRSVGENRLEVARGKQPVQFWESVGSHLALTTIVQTVLRSTNAGHTRAFDYTASALRPLERRRAKTARPLLVAMRDRKP